MFRRERDPQESPDQCYRRERKTLKSPKAVDRRIPKYWVQRETEMTDFAIPMASFISNSSLVKWVESGLNRSIPEAKPSVGSRSKDRLTTFPLTTPKQLDARPNSSFFCPPARSWNTREKADYSTLSVSTVIFRGFPAIENRGHFDSRQDGILLIKKLWI